MKDEASMKIIRASGELGFVAEKVIFNGLLAVGGSQTFTARSAR